MAETTITTLNTCIIKPSSPTPPQHMFLAAPDFVWRWFHYNQRILFFKLDQKQQAVASSDSFIEYLKSSLALALVEFFPWAGRVFEQESGRLALDCNDAGVPFIEAFIDLPFSSLEDDGFKHKPFFKHFAPHGDVLQWTGPDLPLISVQVTRFPGDEGYVLGIGHSHIVADGSSLWHFIKSWGECARGVPLSMHPIHMREELRPEKLILPPPPPKDEEGVPWHALAGGGNKVELVQRDFHFTSEMVKKLKHMATTSAPATHAPFSSLQALSAHIWRHVIAALDMDQGEKSVFNVIANMRPRLVPPLPEAYFGNAISRDGTIAMKGELQQESLGVTALRIQQLIKTLDDTFTRTLYGKTEVLPFSKIFEGYDFTMVGLHLSSSPRFPVYEVDFGWGPPVCVRCPCIRGNGEMVWFPGRGGGGSVDVALAVTKPVMDRLEQDTGFLAL